MLNDTDLNDADSSTPPAAEAAATPPRRRRAASRPAGPPAEKPVVQETVPAAEKAAAPATTEPVAQTAPAEPAPAAEPAAEPAKRPTRRRATRAQAAPTEPAAEAAPEATAPAEAPAAESEAAPAEQPAKTTRKRTTTARSTRATKAKAAETEPQPESEPAQAPVAELLESAQAAQSAPARGRGRRVASKVADPFQAPDPEAVLQNLAATIAGQGIEPVELDELEAEKAPEPARTTRRRATRSSRAKQAPVVEETPEQDQDEAAIPTEADQAEVEQAEVEQVDAAQTDEQGEESEADTDQTDAEGAEDTEAEDADAEDTDSEDGDSEDSDSDEESDSDEGDEPREGRRRRRRRGGRRRRRSGSDGESGSDEADSEGDSDSEDEDDEAGSDEATGDTEDGSSDSSRRRRRRRRRRGEDTSGAEDDPSDVVVRVREPRRTRSSQDEITSIEGSTRMAAKKMRRQEGRAAGRRRAPILSEAEFLARRESVERRMIVRQREDYTQLAVLEDGVLVEHYVDRASSASMIGNIYLGRVQNVLPGMEAAFIDIGRGRNAVLYAGEIDWETYGVQGEQRKVEQVFKSGQTVLVQVSKDPVGAKGARLTSHISIPGRYLVYSPGGHLSGISRKLADTERNRLKEILGQLIDEKASVIVRTAAEGVSEDELVRDVNRLKTQWEIIEKKVKQGSAPALLYGEPDLTVRTVRDLFTEDFSSLAIQGNGSAEDAYEAISGYVSHVAPHLADRISRWDAEADGDIFAAQRIDEQIAKALERKVFLPSGGSLIIDRTEAMTVIDVNTGRFTGTSNNLEATVTSNNLEAAEEIVRQLRLRDIGGIIVIDFIDMVLPANRDLLIRRLVECLSRDRTRHQVAEVTSLGLVQLTRKKIGTGLAEAFTEQCEHCGGRGYHRFDEPVESQAPSDGGDRHGRNGGHGHGNGGHGGNGGGNGNGGSSNGGSGRSRGGRRRGGRSSGSSDD